MKKVYINNMKLTALVNIFIIALLVFFLGCSGTVSSDALTPLIDGSSTENNGELPDDGATSGTTPPSNEPSSVVVKSVENEGGANIYVSITEVMDAEVKTYSIDVVMYDTTVESYTFEIPLKVNFGGILADHPIKIMAQAEGVNLTYPSTVRNLTTNSTTLNFNHTASATTDGSVGSITLKASIENEASAEKYTNLPILLNITTKRIYTTKPILTTFDINGRGSLETTKSSSADDWSITLQDTLESAIRQNDESQFSLAFANVKNASPLTIDAKTEGNIEISQNSFLLNDTNKVNFDTTFLPITKVGDESATITLTVDGDSQFYEGVPYDIQIQVQRSYDKATVSLKDITTVTEGVTVEGTDNNRIVRIVDTQKATADFDSFSASLSMSFDGIITDIPLAVTVGEANNLTLSTANTTKNSVTLDAIHNAREFFITTNGSNTLTISAVGTEHLYANLPLVVNLQTERADVFKHYAQDYVNSFYTSSSGDTKDDSKYYTSIIIPAFDLKNTKTDGQVTFTVTRTDDTGTKNLILNGSDLVTSNASTITEIKDFDALILTKEPLYTVTLKHSTITGGSVTSVEKVGTRKLTEREALIATIETIRNSISKLYIIEDDAGGTNLKYGSKDGGLSGKYYMGITRNGFWSSTYRRFFSYNNYKDGVVTLNGSIMKDQGGGSNSNEWHGIWRHHDTASYWTDNGNFPRTDTLTVTYGDITYQIEVKDIKITDENFNNPNWDSGHFLVNNNSSYTNDKNKSNYIHFGFTMNSFEGFRDLVAPGGSYKQK